MKTLIFTIAILGSSSLFAQSIERQVLGSTGGMSVSGTVIVTSTVGETAVTTETSSAITLTQGYQQSSSSSVSINENDLKVSNLRLFPNPTTNLATLALTADNANSTVTIQVFSVTGQLISTQSLSLASGIESTLKLDVSNQAAGAYLVRISDSNSSLSKTLRLVKQ